jgi:hypothetical protein
VVVFRGGELVSSPFCCVVLAGGVCPVVLCSSPNGGFNEICLLIALSLFIVLVVCSLESPSEL